MSGKIIDLAKDFSPRPFGRFRKEYLEQSVDRSGEAFRENFLLPEIQIGRPFTVDLSGSNRYGSSFLEEAFGGLIRVNGCTKEQIGLMTIKHDLLPSVVEEVQMYMKDAFLKRK